MPILLSWDLIGHRAPRPLAMHTRVSQRFLWHLTAPDLEYTKLE